MFYLEMVGVNEVCRLLDVVPFSSWLFSSGFFPGKLSFLQEKKNINPIGKMLLLDDVEKYHLLTNCHYGYRKNESTELASILLLDDIRKSVDWGDLVGAVFIDLSKAFDTIRHEILLSKLPLYGIRNIELTWFTDYLFSRKQLVNFDKCFLKRESVLCGVPQGQY